MRTRIYFTSDAHLGSGYHLDPAAVERRLVRWLELVRPTARAIYFLGDMFDYWFEYKGVVPRGFVRFLGMLGQMSDEGIEIHFFAGNHDVWFSDYLPQEIGATIHHKSELVKLDGKLFRLSHGDEEYTHLSWVHRFLYKLFRNPIARRLYSAIHPRWTVGFALAWSLHSRKQGLARQTLGRVPHAYHNEYFELEQEPLIRFAQAYAQEHPEIDYYLFGHRHILVDLAMRGDKRVLILGDWLQYNSYAVWDGQNIWLEQFEIDYE